MIEETTKRGAQAVEFRDMTGIRTQVQRHNTWITIESCSLDREQTTALVERLQLWLATGSLHKGEGK